MPTLSTLNQDCPCFMTRASHLPIGALPNQGVASITCLAQQERLRHLQAQQTTANNDHQDAGKDAADSNAHDLMTTAGLSQDKVSAVWLSATDFVLLALLAFVLLYVLPKKLLRWLAARRAAAGAPKAD